MVKKITCNLIALVFMASLLGFSHAPLPPKSGEVIRVAIVKGKPLVRLLIKGPFGVYSLNTNELLAEYRGLDTSVVTPTDFGLQIGTFSYFKIYGIKIVPKRDAAIYVDKRCFRGQIDIIRQQDKTLLIVNHIDVENYIRGVLYHEVSHKWPLESIKAQAVAARTYALYQKKINEKNDFDVTNDVYSQVYGGQTSEKYRTNKAVNQTLGEYLTFKGEVFPAYFHAACAGHTEDASRLWNIDLPPLKGKPCDFCGKSPHSKWKINLRLADIQVKLIKSGKEIGLIKEINVLERNNSGRVEKLEIIDRRGSKIYISGKDFRMVVGPDIIRSTNFEVIMRGYYVDFVGKGWGHGVGLCQWGAKSMSECGFTYDQILKYYYPGSEISK
ncbi:MAG: SpoIID/LytB domain-containing protein [Candidatus Omnitrophica bacterium]|nr:SpoIID/LytB domain-containing protein [Candidatus Omnitrophota bacterium]HOX54239.1 SpoIID/LytB domain-containing protein [Candidatus Omnitrophota bacterium]